MNWFWVIACWLISLMAIGYGFYLTKEVHEKMSAIDYSYFFNISSDTVIGWIFGAIVGIIFGLFVGLFFKILPWWLARSIHFGIGIGMFLLGLHALSY